MNHSREYLQKCPQQKKIREIDNIISEFVLTLQRDAELGKTFYMYETHLLENFNRIRFPQNPQSLEITINDFIIRLKQRFPDCEISYRELWIDQSNNTRVLKKGIVIDWN